MESFKSHLYSAYNPWWEHSSFDTGFLRSSYLDRFTGLCMQQDLMIAGGGRKTGKSTILFQVINRMLEEGLPPRQILYITFEHPRFAHQTISSHLEAYYQIFPEARENPVMLVLDEVQESPSWETEIAELAGNPSVHTLCSGSSANFLKKLGDKLKHKATVIHPFSYNEYHACKEAYTRSCLPDERCVEHFLYFGGYPAQVIEYEEKYMEDLLEEIIARDLLAFHDMPKPSIIRDCLRFMSIAVGMRLTDKKLASVSLFPIDKIKEYTDNLEASLLTTSVERWLPPDDGMEKAQRKYYFYDTGIKTHLTGWCDVGPLAENAVLLHLQRAGMQPCYWTEENREVDFVLGTEEEPMAIDVRYVDDFNWNDDAFSGIRLFLKRFPGTGKIVIVTRACEKTFTCGSCTIMVLPLWKFLADFDCRSI